MNKICRLCFIVMDNVVSELTAESEIMSKLKSCLHFELSLSEQFPKQICEICRTKVEDIHNFRDKVVQNECKLMHCLNNNTLISFYSELVGNVKNEEIPNSLETYSTNIMLGMMSESFIKEEDESQDTKDFDVTYCEPNINLDIKVDNDTESGKLKKSQNSKCPKLKTNKICDKNGELKTRKSKPKMEVKQKSDKKVKSPKINRNVIRKDKYAEHDPNKCLTCFKLLDSSLELSKHYKNEHSIEPGSLKPDVDMADKFTLHEMDGRMFFKCNTCGDSNEDVKEMTKHVVLHKYERPFVCKLCGKTYKTVYEIVRHGRVHSGFKLFCQHGCGYSSPYPGALRDHEKRHTDDRNYTCKTCGKGFLVKTWFDQHQNIHKNVKPFVCDFCGMAFHMHRYLVTHRNKRHPGLSAITKYTCTQCSFTCDNKSSLTFHMEEHAENPAEAKLTLLCDLCGKGFARTDHLTNHKNGKHFGIKPYSCSICNKQFQKKFNLSVHTRIHSGEGRRLCRYCGKLFAQKSTLHRHQKKRHPEEYNGTKEVRPTE